MHTKQIIDNVPKKNQHLRRYQLKKIANILLAFIKQLSINKPLPKINGLAACHCNFCESLLAPDKLNNKWKVLQWNQYQIQ